MDRVLVHSLQWRDALDVTAGCHTKGCIVRALLLQVMRSKESFKHEVKKCSPSRCNQAAPTSEELPIGRETCEECAAICLVGACESSHWGRRWNSLWGHEARQRCAEIGAVGACDHSHWGRRWSSLWCREACGVCAEMGAVGACERSRWRLRWSSLGGYEEGMANWVCETHADGDTGAFGGAPCRATKRVRGVANWACVTHAGGCAGAFRGAPCGAAKR
eukprot:4924256-Pyramimonas_sp.AAC.1